MRFACVAGIVSALTLILPAPVHGQAPGSVPARANGPLADSLRAAAYRMADLLRNRDVSALIALYGDTLHFVHVDDGTIIPWPQLSTTMRNYLTTVTSNPISVVGEPGVTLIDQNTAVLYITHRFDGGQGRDAHEGVWTGVLRRFDDGWKIIHSHSSDRHRAEDAQHMLNRANPNSAHLLGFRLGQYIPPRENPVLHRLEPRRLHCRS